jgi:tRNA-binding protein
MVARMDMPPHARAGGIGRGHRFAAYPRCSTDYRASERTDWVATDVATDCRLKARSYVAEFKPAPLKPAVSVADLDKLDVRVGSIVAVEDVPKSAKLLRLTVDFGDHRRTILAGMKAERPNPQELVGRQALFVVNLEPRRMAGEMSEGMFFDIGYADGVLPALAVPERPVPNGVRAS